MKKTKQAKLKMAAPPAPMQRLGARHLAFMALAAIVGWAGGYAIWTVTRPAPATDRAQVQPADQVKPKAPSTVVGEDTSQFRKLKGKWVRPDGGYVLEVSSVDEKGRIEATYLNPQPIQVAKAEASQKGATTKLFIELSGQNYAGSTYELTYDSVQDQLTGVYYQAVLQERFDVIFVRMSAE